MSRSGRNTLTATKNSETYHTYAYADTGWSDLLTAFDGGAITYDNIGNPLTYHDGKTFTWTAGRRLASATDGETVITYAYDGDGNRIRKTVNGETTEYEYIDGKLLSLKKGADVLRFLYDETDTVYGFLYNGDVCYYVFNLQGDITGIRKADGWDAASYSYDAWGNPTGIYDDYTTLATLNPFRYRGYFYDDETGFYYLQSRYYDPEVGRFINADGYASTGQGILGYNQFAYCLNNPVRFLDDSGSRCVEDGPNSRWVMVTNSGRVVSSEPRTESKGLSPNQFYNKDGSYSLYDNQRSDPDSVFHEQIFAAKVSSPSISVKDGTATLGSANAYFMTGGWEFEHVDMSLLDIGNAKLSLGVENGTLNVAAMASAWTPSVTVVIWDVNITLSAHVGSVGGKLYMGKEGIGFDGSLGIGAGVSVSW